MDTSLLALINVIVFTILLFIIKKGSSPEFTKKHPTLAELSYVLAFTIFSVYVVLLRHQII